MKELSIEQKAKRYDEAIEKARIWKDKSGMPKDKQGILDDIFPELAESEDERIVKELLTFFRESIHGGHILTNKEYDSWIAWLEKQVNHANFRNKIEVGDKVTRNRDGVLINLSQLNRVAKPAAKVEPKFKIGDWITDGNITVQIEAIKNDCYLYCGDCVLYSTKTADKVYHLWTIQDAKNGDVLVCPKYAGDIIPNIFIFKDIKIKDNDVFCYCSFLETFRTEGYIANADPINTDFYPATKEQRDLLFQKMKEAGYIWDAEKKELKKVEQKPWSEEDEENLNWFEKFFRAESVIAEGKDIPQDRYLWFKNLKNRVLPQPKQEWSEEDEEHIKSLLERLEGMCKKDATFIRTKFAVSEDED